MTQPELAPRSLRDAEIDAATGEIRASLVADDRKRKAGGIAFAAVALAAIGAVWFIKQGDGTDARANTEHTVAERKPVPKLNAPEAATVQPVGAAKETPAPTPATVAQEDDALRAQREQMELQRREQERRMLEARMKSSIIPPNTGAQPSHTVEAREQLDGEKQHMVADARAPQDANSRFARAVSGNGVAVSRANRLVDLEYKVLQGKLIEAVLEPRAISDLPGMICANVQRDVYGAQGRVKLIPWGSRVCGTYNAELRKGQDRLFVVWNTLRRPDGVQVAIDSSGADQLGTAGMGGRVDTHFAEIFGISAMLSIIGAGASTMGVGSMDQQNSASYYRQSVTQAAAQTSQQVLQPYANMPPTITVPAGSRVRIYVNKDLDFTAVEKTASLEAAEARGDGVLFIQ
ncbi:TrbI/VirB10 family protein [Variovorax sp. J22P168]|uniref:TrbI/VirB10 family protein n=1 Tax=Variovorax jilinensis TaxID=3053513 RepID=UPI0025761E13|nr:TrbI/VirB10 family protein [Variovorax sp. J22P168]MDM0015043.1 TrbI/VirB10 family protein [Variovorax sp. J22P168]